MSALLRFEFLIIAVSSTSKNFAAEKVVKVPEMAESITEGTLKQWSKSG